MAEIVLREKNQVTEMIALLKSSKAIKQNNIIVYKNKTKQKKWNHTIRSHLCLASAASHVFEIHSHCSMNRYFSPFLWLNNIPLHG